MASKGPNIVDVVNGGIFVDGKLYKEGFFGLSAEFLWAVRSLIVDFISQ